MSLCPLPCRMLTLLLALTWGAAAAAQSASGVRVVRLETEAAREPLGIDATSPRLTWALASERRGVLQRGFRVMVASQTELLRSERADVHDSGNVDSADPWTELHVRPLASRTRYFWTVRVRDERDRWTAWSAPSWFETAQLDEGDWQGGWIAGPERRGVLTADEGRSDDASIRAGGEFCRPVAWPTVPIMDRVPNNQGVCRELRPAPMLRRSFVVTKPLRRARIYASGLGVHALSLNGADVSDRVLDPQFTNYQKTVLYVTHDVTSSIRRGENVIASVLGSGKFDDAAGTWDWGWDRAEWRGTPRLRLDLRLTYVDGSEEVVASDTSWRVSVDGPTRYDSFYLGETYDARREIPGWNRVGFDATSWPAARLVAAPAGTLRAEAAEPSRVVATRTPGTRRIPTRGVVVYDVGQNLSGWATISVRAPAGTAVEVFYSEKLGADGRASTEGNALVGGQLQTDYYVARGGGTERWTPRYSWKGFQYVQLTGPGGAPLPVGVTVAVDSVQHVRMALTASSTFAAAEPLLRRIHDATTWAIQSNVQTGIITDTPIYEKNPWTGDAALIAGTASTMFDTRRLYAKLFQDMLDAQTDQGEVPLLAPTNQNYGYVGKPAFKPPACCGATPPWDAFWFVVPWEAYQRFGDRRALERTYPAMRKYLDDWIPRWTNRDGDAYAHTLTAGLGDWDAPLGVDPVIGLSVTAYYAEFARIAANVARVLDRAEDAARYDTLFARIRNDFNAKYLRSDGVYQDTTPPQGPRALPGAGEGAPARSRGVRAIQQTPQVLALAFDLVPDSLRRAVANRLADDVLHARGGNEYVGILGARHILPELSRSGHADVAYAIATQTDYPSYGYWTDSLKWTTLAEYWEPTSRSRNHHMFGAIGQWFYEQLAGMRPVEPGYRRIEFRPDVPNGLASASARHESVRGPVAVAWRRTASGLELDVTVPPNATGTVHVPATGADLVMEVGGGRATLARRAVGVRLLSVAGGRVLFEVGSGSYKFRVRNGSGRR